MYSIRLLRILSGENFCLKVIHHQIVAMKKIILLLVCFYSAYLQAQNVGIGTETPSAMLDVNGDVVFRTSDLIVTDSIETALDVNTLKFSSYRISADTSFAIAGITAGMDGRIITLINRSGFLMELLHDDIIATGSNRILTGDQQVLGLEPMGIVTLQYDTSSMKWLVKSNNLVNSVTGVWDTTGMNIYFENYVGIGTEEPIAPLTIETAVNETGLLHMAGPDSVMLESKITELGGAMGTSTYDVFSLNTSGTGKMHILPDGDVVIGNVSSVGDFIGQNPVRTHFNSKLRIHTDINETGWMHIGGSDSIIVKEAIGGVTASLGTQTNHAFRFVTNNTGRMHILGDGRIVVSPNNYAAHGQFTVHTDNNSFGLSHLGADGQILASRVGGVAGSAAIGTYSPHHMRIVCNGANAISVWSPTLNVGIGEDAPSEKLTVRTADGNHGISHRSDGGIFLSTHVGAVSASFGTRSNHNFRLVTNDLPRLNITYDGKVGIGTINPIYLFEVNGTMRSKEIIVETVNWPDYVFDESYQLPSLKELEEFIRAHQHLPDIPTASEMEQNGMLVGETQKKMMEKIEELTLYILELHHRIELLENKTCKN